MTFALTGGETGEARLLDLLFCLVTPHHPHRIHHCCMVSRRRPPDSHPLLHHFRLRLSSHLLPLLISNMLELLRLSMLELLRYRVDAGPNAARKRARDTMAPLNNKTQHPRIH
jgi:hypothetical protein